MSGEVIRYHVEAQRLGGSGHWEPSPHDGEADVFCVIRRAPDGAEAIIAATPTRYAADGFISRLIAAQRLAAEEPPAAPPRPKPRPLRTLLLGVPVVVAFWILCAMLGRLT